MAASRWPRVDVQRAKTSARGGSKVGDKAKQKVFVSITLRTRMKCGDEIQVRGQKVHNTGADAQERALRDDIGIKARAHERDCRKCAILK